MFFYLGFPLLFFFQGFEKNEPALCLENNVCLYYNIWRAFRHVHGSIYIDPPQDSQNSLSPVRETRDTGPVSRAER
jgi:hypothetical protein